MIDLKKILNKPVNLSGPKGLDKNPLIDKFRDNKTKRVNLQYKEDIENAVIIASKIEKPIRIRKPRERKDVVDADTKKVIKSGVQDSVAIKFRRKRDIKPVVDTPAIKKKVKQAEVKPTPKPMVEESTAVKELSPKVVQAKEDLANLKKTFAKLLLPVKWSRKSVSVDSEE